MRFYITVIILLSSITGYAAGEDTMQMKKNAINFFIQKKYDEAIELYTKIINVDGKRADAIEMRGLAYNNLSEYKKALADYNMAIKLVPDNAIYYYNRGYFYYQLGMQDNAVEDYSRAIPYAAKILSGATLYISRSNIKYYKHDVDGALDDLRTILKEDSTNYVALIDISADLGELKKYDESIAYLEVALRHYPEDYAVYTNLAQHYVTINNFKYAVELNNKAIILKPTEPYAYNNRGFAKYKLNDLKGALADINKSLELYPANSYAYKNRALIYIALKKTDLACIDLKDALKNGFTATYGNEVNELIAQYCK